MLQMIFFVLIWSCILKKLRCLMGQWQQGYYYFHDLITCSSTAVITSGCTSSHYVSLLDSTQTHSHQGVRQCGEWACAVDTARGCTSHHQPPYSYASLPQITASPSNNSGHISILPIDLIQEVLKEKEKKKESGCEVSAPRVHLVLSPITVRQTVC